MARPKKAGLDYFPMDVNFFDDEILIAISGEFGIKGELAVVKLLCAVYSKGYFAVWSDLLQAKIAKQIGITPDLVNQIVARLVLWGFFDKNLFDSAKVLTSVDIQETYLEATKRRKSYKPTEYWINDDINSSSSGVNADINTQIKKNKTKQNKTKTNTMSPSEEFGVEIWTAYPSQNRQGNYQQAQEAYVQAVTTGETTKEKVLAKIAEYKAYLELNHIQAGYTKSAGNWFIGHMWQSSWDTKNPAHKPEKSADPNPAYQNTTDWGQGGKVEF